MILHPKYIFLHVPKTGGTWVRMMLQLSGGIERELKGHNPYSKVTPKDRPAFCFVRNPWDWYISLYCHYHQNLIQRRHEFRAPRLAWRKHTHDLATVFGGSFEEMFMHLDTTLSETLKGICTKPYPEAKDPLVYRYEDGLSDQLILFLNHVGVSNTEKIESFSESRFNASKETDKIIYTDRLIDIVRERDRGLIEQYGYKRPIITWGQPFRSS